MAKQHSTETHNFDRLDLVDDLNKQLSSLKTTHVLMQNYLKSALRNDLKITPNELREFIKFNSGLDNIFKLAFSRVKEILDALNHVSQ